jgi:hypothetical protein
MTHPIPAEAITAAAEALHKIMCLFCSEPSLRAEPPCHRQPTEANRAASRLVLEAAQPHLAYAAGKAAGDRIAQLTALAAEILASYSKTGDGYRGRVGQVQIATWTARLDGERG